MKLIKLLLIDEVHIVSEPTRGATLETIVSRMKTLSKELSEMQLRIIAVSATCPNIIDIAEWLRNDEFPAEYRYVP